MIVLLLALTIWLQLNDRHDDALIVVLAALTLAVVRLRVGWMRAAWQSGIESETLFEGRDDER